MDNSCFLELGLDKQYEAEVIGGKAFGIQKLIHHHIQTPTTLILTDPKLQSFGIESNNTPTGTPSKEFDACLNHILDFFGPIPLIVRSSSNLEDGTLFSGAGIFKSVPGVVTKNELKEAIKNVYQSKERFNDNSIKENVGLNSMHVIVQPLIHAQVSGVIFSRNPVNGDPSEIIIEANFGFPSSVVEGNVDVDRYQIDKVIFEIRKKHIGTKEIRYHFQDGKLIKERSMGNHTSCLTMQDIEFLFRKTLEIETLLGFPLDLEWAIASSMDLGRSCYWLQVRPIVF